MRVIASAAGALLLLLGGCGSDTPPGRDYYERTIQPILTQSCSQGTSGCHAADPADPFAFAAGNLDTTSYDNLIKRKDLLTTYGAYPVPMLLMKAVGPTDELVIAYRDEFLSSEVPHGGGAILSVGSPAFLTLQDWLDKGATRDGQAPPAEARAGEGGCSAALPADFDPATVTSTALWTSNQSKFNAAQSVIESKGCGSQTCHGAPQADFYITCGDNEAQRAFNFAQMRAFVDSPVDDSELLQWPLALTAGGVTHTGGAHFSSRDDADYESIRDFASAVGPMDFGGGDPAKEFFANEVMPVLLARGCAAQGCHSPAAMNDFKMRAGTQGFFSALALEKNYELVKKEFTAFEVPDVRRSRMVAKNILSSRGGISHRGGPLLETAGSGGSDPAACPSPWTAASSVFCTFVEWARIERAAIGDPNSGATVPLVYVERDTTDVAGPLEFATYQAPSDLLVRAASVSATGAITGVGAASSLLDNCGIADRSQVDVRSPEVRYDGDTIVFAMRRSASEGLAIWKVQLDGSGCTRLTPQTTTVHRFDPVWSPDGEWIVFASNARGGTTRRGGRPQSDLWRMHADGTGAEEITWLSDSEFGPGFLREGRISMSTEKADPRNPQQGFYQVSGRRLNWDLTDYHPLLAQRKTSPVDPSDPGGTANPSFDYSQATEIREGFDGNFLVVLSDTSTKAGAGTLGIFNRSVGPMEAGRSDPGYLRSLVIPDPAATGRGNAVPGAYRSPFPLLDGKVMASYASGSLDLSSPTSLDWDLVAVDPRTGARTTILSAPGAQVEAVLALAHPPRELYENRRQLVFGGSADPSDPSHAVVNILDAPMIATLLGANLRRGRFVDALRDASAVVFFGADGQELGRADLAGDGSARVRVPSRTPVLIGIADGSSALFTMTEEHQFGPGERISMGVREGLFDHVCAGCHGSVSGRELDATVAPDALTGASQSESANRNPTTVGP